MGWALWDAGELPQYTINLLHQKKCFQVCVYMLCTSLLVCHCSDAAYQARIQLAVLDRSAHLNREIRQHSETEAYQYHRRYRKQTNVVKVYKAKEY